MKNRVNNRELAKYSNKMSIPGRTLASWEQTEGFEKDKNGLEKLCNKHNPVNDNSKMAHTRTHRKKTDKRCTSQEVKTFNFMMKV